MTDLNLGEMALADGVVETIVAISLQDVEGVSLAGANSPAGFFGSFAARPQTAGIEVNCIDQQTLHVSVHIEVTYGYALPEVAGRVRSVIADAVLTQVGVEVSSVDVFIDGIQF